MARFSVDERDDGEGSSSARFSKRQKTSSSSSRPTLNTHFEDENASDRRTVEEKDREDSRDKEDEDEEDELEQEEQEEDDDDDDDDDDDVFNIDRADDDDDDVTEEANNNSNIELASGRPRPSDAPTCTGPARCGSIFVTLTDPEVLDCCICYEPLTIPVFQCENGHTACSSCCKKLAHKCPSCSLPIGYNRCRAIEKVLDSVRMSCSNAQYGCKEIVVYSKKNDHEKSCSYASCSCPLSSCNFVSSSKLLYLHFSSKHPGSAIRFTYNMPAIVFFTVNEKFLVLQEEKEGVLFILNNKTEVIGNAITVSCLGLSSRKEGYFYDLSATTERGSLRFQSFTKYVQSKVDSPLPQGFLLVPNDFFGVYGQICLDLCIWRYGDCPPDIRSAMIPS